MDSLTLEVFCLFAVALEICKPEFRCILLYSDLLLTAFFCHFSSKYTYLLTSQLENQRLYFQEKITQIEKDAADQASTNTRSP